MVTANWSPTICKYKGRIGFRLYLIPVLAVQTGEGGNARPLVTVGGEEVPAQGSFTSKSTGEQPGDADSDWVGLGPELLRL